MNWLPLTVVSLNFAATSGFSGRLIAVIKDFLLITLAVDGLHDQSLLALLAGADVGAGAAAGAVQGGDGHGKLHSRARRSYPWSWCPRERSASSSSVIDDGTDDGMGADIRAEVALDAVFRNPAREHPRRCRASHRRQSPAGTVPSACVHEGGNRQLVALLGVDRDQDVVDIVDQILSVAGSQLAGLVARRMVFQEAGTSTLTYAGDAAFDGGVVHVDDLLALLAVGLGGGVLHILDGIIHGDDVGEFKEGGLQNGVGAAAQADAPCRS